MFVFNNIANNTISQKNAAQILLAVFEMFALSKVLNNTISLKKGEMLHKFCWLFSYVLYNRGYVGVNNTA